MVSCPSLIMRVQTCSRFSFNFSSFYGRIKSGYKKEKHEWEDHLFVSIEGTCEIDAFICITFLCEMKRVWN